jgi:hypothetical protein
MRNRNPNGRRRTVAALTSAALAATLAVALALGWSAGSAFAQNAAEDEEEVPLDTKLFRQWMKDLGLQRNGEGIEYRERAPLVVPPNRNLPPPQSGAAITANPAWPNDPDVKQRKADTVRKKQPARTAAETMDLEGRPLSRAELEKGRVAAGTADTAGPSPTPEEAGRALKPSELGSKSLFSDMFSSFGPEKPETAPFSGEPVRDNLTAPPAGYQTPSPNQPYGLSPKGAQNTGKAMTLEDRAVGPPR